MKRILSFIKRYGLVIIVLAPMVLFMIGWPMMVIGESAHGAPGLLYKTGSFMVSMLFGTALLVYPFILTGCNLYLIVRLKPERYKKTVSALSEIGTIVLGALYSQHYVAQNPHA